jgi:HK97 family phage major capsid protein
MTAMTTTAPETKAMGPEARAAYDQFMRNFETFKAENDVRIEQIERRGSADVLSEDKVTRINAALDEQRGLIDQLMLKQARPVLGGAAPRTGPQMQHKAAFEAYVRKGEPGALAALEAKALSITSATDGGYLVPPETEAAVTLAMRDISPIRAIASVQQVSSNVYLKPFSTNGFAAGWVGETAARPQTATTTLSNLTFQTMELYAMPAATNQLLDDSIINIDQWIADEVKVTFAQQEGTAFVSGDGVSKPKGFLSYPMIAQASYAWGSLGYLATGVAGALPATNPSDKLIDLVYTLKAQYRPNARWIMSRGTQAVIRKLKDQYGDYLWQPALTPGGAPSLMGFPIAESEDMPAIATGAFSLGFGDFGRGYLIVDRVGMRILRDPFTVKPYVLFYTTKRVGGGVQDFDAIKLLKFDVS